MARVKTCMICGQPIDEKNQKAVPYKGRYAHEKCFNTVMKITVQEKHDKMEEAKKDRVKKNNKTTPIKVVQDYKTEEEFQEQKRFFDLLKQITDLERLPARVYKIAEDYVKKYGFSYKGMEDAIRYFVFVKENKVEGDGIGIIPYIYEEAQDYYLYSEAINKENEKIMERGDKLYQTRTIRIKPDYNESSQLINMEDFWGDADAN